MASLFVVFFVWVINFNTHDTEHFDFDFDFDFNLVVVIDFLLFEMNGSFETVTP